MGRGYQGAPKGGALAAAGLPLGIKSPADGDLLAYDLASGKWVNSGNSKIGFQAHRYNFVTDGTYQTVDFPGEGGSFINWHTGWTLAGDNKAWNTPAAGRYLVGITAFVPQHATLWLSVSVSPPASASAFSVVPPLSIVDLSTPGGVGITHVQPALYSTLPDTETWAVQVIGAVATIEIFCWAQYLTSDVTFG